MDIINSIISLGASVMMPVIFFIIALCFGVKIGTAFKAGMLVGIGFEGVGLVIGLLLTNLGPASQAMVERIGLHLTVVDTGWGAAPPPAGGGPGPSALCSASPGARKVARRRAAAGLSGAGDRLLGRLFAFRR